MRVGMWKEEKPGAKVDKLNNGSRNETQFKDSLSQVCISIKEDLSPSVTNTELS